MRQIILLMSFSFYIWNGVFAQSLLESNSKSTRGSEKEHLNQKIESLKENYLYDPGKCYLLPGFCNPVREFTNLPEIRSAESQIAAALTRRDSTMVKLLLEKLIISFNNDITEKKKQMIKQADLFLKKIDSLQKNEARLYYKNNNLAIIIDTGYNINSKQNLWDSLSFIAGEMYILKRDLDNLYSTVSAYQKDTLFYDLSYFSLSVSNNIDSVINKAKEKFSDINARTTFIGKNIKNADSIFYNLSKKWDNVLETFKNNKESKTGTRTDLGALPGLSAILGQKEVNLNISVLGSQLISNEKSSIYGEIRLFTSGIKTDSIQNRKTLFLPEASTFGISGKLNFGFGPIRQVENAKRIGINMEFHILGKKIKPDNTKDETSISPLVFHTKTGLEIIAIKNILSIYFNINTLTPLDKVADYRSGLSIKKNFFGFVDFGTRMLLIPKENFGGLKLKVDLGFISNGGEIKSILQSEDLVIPTFRLGLQKDFGL